MKALVLKLTILCGFTLTLVSPLKGDEALNPVLAHQAQIREKLNTIFVSVDLKNASVKQAIEAIASASHKADPNHQGIAFYVQPNTFQFEKPITLKLEHVPVGVALHYMCELTEFYYTINDRFVDILPPPFGDYDLSKETFHVDPSFLETAQSAGVIPQAQMSP